MYSGNIFEEIFQTTWGEILAFIRNCVQLCIFRNGKQDRTDNKHCIDNVAAKRCMLIFYLSFNGNFFQYPMDKPKNTDNYKFVSAKIQIELSSQSVELKIQRCHAAKQYQIALKSLYILIPDVILYTIQHGNTEDNYIVDIIDIKYVQLQAYTFPNCY